MHSPNAVSMLAHRIRRWPNIETALGECLVFAGRAIITLSRCMVYLNFESKLDPQ